MPLLWFLVRRLLWGVAILVLTAFCAFGGLRAARPDRYPGEAWWDGTRGDLERVFVRGDLGAGCFQIGCPPLGDYLKTFWTADVYLLAGTFFFAVVFGIGAGVWCAARPRSRASRAVEAAGALLYCTPVYVVGLGLLLLFAPIIGIFEVPVLFELHTYLSPTENPVTFLTAMLVPWLVSAAPVGAMIMRVTIGLIREIEDRDFIRTAFAKGIALKHVVRRHAAPTAYVPVASLVGISVPLIVLNAILVETVFNIPGNFRFIRRAIVGPDPPGPNPDYESLQILAIYVAIFTVVMTTLVDLVIEALGNRGRPD